MRISKYNKIALVLSALFIISLVLFAIFRDNTQSVTLSKAKNILNSKDIKKVILSSEYVYLKTKDNIYKIPISQINPELLKEYKVEVDNGKNKVVYILFFVLFVALGLFIYRWIRINKITLSYPQKNESKSTSKQDINTNSIKSMKSDVKFSDIGGISDVKSELEEIIDFMKNPKRYKSFGAYMPRGVLLVGPPGVGKTMIAKAVAHEAEVPFYYQSGASFVQIYVGMGAKRVHELFEAAKNNAPAIIFIDEIDAVGKTRDGQRNDEREATLNQLLTEMDGFESSSGVIVVAATNKIDVLDAALLRAGRFDRRIFVELPTKKERESILSKYLNNIPHNLDIRALANMTVGFNGASLAALVNEAALLSLRQNDLHVTTEHFHHVKDKVMFGKKKIQILSEKQKEYRIAYQAAKVFCATYFDLPFEKLMLSNEKLTPSTDEPLLKHELESRIQMLLAGMAGCELRFSEHSTDAKSDLDEAKELLKKMLNEYGMGRSLIYNEDEEEIVIRELYIASKNLIDANKEVVFRIEKILSEKESITKSQVKEFLNEVL